MGQSGMDNPEKLATQGKQEIGRTSKNYDLANLNMGRVLDCLFIAILSLEFQYSKDGGYDVINMYNPTECVWLSMDITWLYKAI